MPRLQHIQPLLTPLSATLAGMPMASSSPCLHARSDQQSLLAGGCCQRGQGCRREGPQGRGEGGAPQGRSGQAAPEGCAGCAGSCCQGQTYPGGPHHALQGAQPAALLWSVLWLLVGLSWPQVGSEHPCPDQGSRLPFVCSLAQTCWQLRLAYLVILSPPRSTVAWSTLTSLEDLLPPAGRSGQTPLSSPHPASHTATACAERVTVKQCTLLTDAWLVQGQPSQEDIPDSQPRVPQSQGSDLYVELGDGQEADEARQAPAPAPAADPPWIFEQYPSSPATATPSPASSPSYSPPEHDRPGTRRRPARQDFYTPEAETQAEAEMPRRKSRRLSAASSPGACLPDLPPSTREPLQQPPASAAQPGAAESEDGQEHGESSLPGILAAVHS